MKKFIIKCLIFTAIAFLADIAIGSGFFALSHKAKSGQAHKNLEIELQATPDILILGSSRSTRHYVPQVLEDSIHKDVFIAGQDGNGIIMMWPVMRYICERHKPDLVVYDVNPAFDLLDDDPQRYMRYVRPLWGKVDEVDDIIKEIEPTEAFKLISSTYRQNSSAPSILKGLFNGELFVKGYLPLYGEFVDGNEANTDTKRNRTISQQKLKFFDDMMTYANNNGINMVFIYSPMLNPNTEPLSELRTIISKHRFEFNDYREDSTFVSNKKFFKDPDHLNHSGAEMFSREIIPVLRKSMHSVPSSQNDTSVKYQ